MLTCTHSGTCTCMHGHIHVYIGYIHRMLNVCICVCVSNLPLGRDRGTSRPALVGGEHGTFPPSSLATSHSGEQQPIYMEDMNQ